MPLFLDAVDLPDVLVQSQIYVNQGLFNSILLSLHESSALTYQSELDSAFFKEHLFDNFEQVYGKE